MYVICDSGPLISLSNNCLFSILPFLSQRSKVDFIIPSGVENEIVNTPIRISKYAFAAMRFKKAITAQEITVIKPKNLLAQKIKNTANNIFSIKGKPLQIVHEGEAECLALYQDYKCQALVIDEKTTKLLIEAPEKLRDIMQHEYGEKIDFNAKAMREFAKLTQGVKILRSTELTAIAAQKGYFDMFPKPREALAAALTSLKNAGCSITEGEIDELAKTPL